MSASAMRVAIAGEGAGPVVHREADIVAALVRAASAARVGVFELADRDGRTGHGALPRAMSAMSPITAEAVASPPAPGPKSVSS